MRNTCSRSSKGSFTHDGDVWVRVDLLLHSQTCFEPIKLLFGGHGGAQPRSDLPSPCPLLVEVRELQVGQE